MAPSPQTQLHTLIDTLVIQPSRVAPGWRAGFCVVDQTLVEAVDNGTINPNELHNAMRERLVAYAGANSVMAVAHIQSTRPNTPLLLGIFVGPLAQLPDPATNGNTLLSRIIREHVTLNRQALAPLCLSGASVKVFRLA